MKDLEALNILDCAISSSNELIKIGYRRACSMYHPDRNPAGLEMMKLINAAYDVLRDYDGSNLDDSTINYSEEINLADHINEALNAIINLGLNIEVCGMWIWVSGDTRPYKEVLKAAGYKWASKKLMWYFAGVKTKGSKGKWDINKIRKSHGSVSIKNKFNNQLAA